MTAGSKCRRLPFFRHEETHHGSTPAGAHGSVARGLRLRRGSWAWAWLLSRRLLSRWLLSGRLPEVLRPSRLASMRSLRALCLLALVLTSLAGCVLEHRRDGGFTVRPFHIH